MIFNMMNYGGGGSVEGAFAIARVTYPSGSACTCEKNDHSYTFEAPDTSGIAIFALPESGSWVVSCTNGTQTATDTIQANTKNSVYEKTLTYGTSPTPGPTPVYETKIVASGYILGAINATSVAGEWTGGDVRIGTSATFVVPDVDTYVVIYVPQDGSGAKYYSVDVNRLHVTYLLNLQTGAVTVEDPSEGDEEGEDPVTETTLNVTFTSGSVTVDGESITYSQVATGRNATNTAAFVLATGETYRVSFISSGSSSSTVRTITATGETMNISFSSDGGSSLTAYTYSNSSSDFSAGSGSSPENVTEWISPARVVYDMGSYIAYWNNAYSVFGENVVVRCLSSGEYHYATATLIPNQEVNVIIEA